LSAERTARGEPLRATGVTAGYGGDPVIRNITVVAEPGEVVSLVGANGSGKSTFLKSLVGLVRVTAGTVVIGETDVTRGRRGPAGGNPGRTRRQPRLRRVLPRRYGQPLGASSWGAWHPAGPGAAHPDGSSAEASASTARDSRP